MSDIAIRAENLGKWYPIGEPERYTMLRDRVAHSLAVPFRRLLQRRKSRSRGDQDGFADFRTSLAGSCPQQVHALKGVSFEIKRGEIVGIIGKNGAGKSTLLKILSRITEPSEGDAFVYGRIGSLLEVGTGFHPELTGRENVYLNGAIIGMKKAEIDRKFDEIVAFAEIEKFIDTPVKRYSSGMYTRLGFSVAAHMEPEIMVVDEVLAVGDAGFQNTCLAKMNDVARDGRTVLFVSHNMAAVRRLCERVILLHAGQVKLDADEGRAVEEYLRISASGSDGTD
jgi:lipopolysaccharide transport system ATP-binding protein